MPTSLPCMALFAMHVRNRSLAFDVRNTESAAQFSRACAACDGLGSGACVRILRARAVLPVARAKPLISLPPVVDRFPIDRLRCHVGRDYDPVQGQWYEDLEENEIFQVLSVDPDEEIVEIMYENGDTEEIDLDTWHELDLEQAQQPEGWAERQGRRRGGETRKKT